MTTSEEILAEISNIFTSKWDEREGRKVPEPEDIQLGNNAVTISGTVLYADLKDSTGLVNNFKNWFAAEIYKSYLLAACRIIKNKGGEITAFDGDRVMAVFIGDSKNSSAARTAMNINYMVREINTLLKSKYPNTAFKLFHSIGIDTSNLYVARTGIRNSNDLVWVGRAANYAAKLCELADENYTIHITSDVYNQLSDDNLYGGTQHSLMWEKTTWPQRSLTVYRTSWWWGV